MIGALTVHVWLVNLHDAIRYAESLEAEFRVQAVRVARREQHATKSLKVGMPHDCGHEAPGETFASVLRENVNVREIAERCPIRDDAGEADLLTLVQDAKAERIGDRAFD
jgi:hypothetical protein